MTPRKELYIVIKNALTPINAIELIDLHRNKLKLPELFTAVFIKINQIEWQNMTNQNQEGKCSVALTLICQEGWANQFNNTTDANDGLSEIELLDTIIAKINGLHGNSFTDLQLASEADNEDETNTTSYTLTFECLVYRNLKSIN